MTRIKDWFHRKPRQDNKPFDFDAKTDTTFADWRYYLHTGERVGTMLENEEADLNENDQKNGE